MRTFTGPAIYAKRRNQDEAASRRLTYQPMGFQIDCRTTGWHSDAVKDDHNDSRPHNAYALKSKLRDKTPQDNPPNEEFQRHTAKLNLRARSKTPPTRICIPSLEEQQRRYSPQHTEQASSELSRTSAIKQSCNDRGR